MTKSWIFSASLAAAFLAFPYGASAQEGPCDYLATRNITGYEAARYILGSDLITPEDVTRARPSDVYAGLDLDKLEQQVPDCKELQWLREHNFVLVAGPPTARNYVELQNMYGPTFYDTPEEIAAYEQDTVGTEWLKLRKEPLPDSFGKNWEEQQALLGANYYVPNLPQVSWVLNIYDDVRKVKLLKRIMVRTSSAGKRSTDKWIYSEEKKKCKNQPDPRVNMSTHFSLGNQAIGIDNPDKSDPNSDPRCDFSRQSDLGLVPAYRKPPAS